MHWKKIVIAAVLVFVLLIAALYAFVEFYDVNKFKPLIVREVKRATGRELNIKGDIEIDARPLVPAGGLGLSEDTTGEGPVLHVTLLRGEGGISLPVHDFLAALLGDALAEPRHCAVVRTGCYGRHEDGRWLTPVEEVGETRLRYWLGRHLVG